MADYGDGPGFGKRDNGLRCAGYTPVRDLDPRVAHALLPALAAHGIAAYVEPTPGQRGGYLEVRLPTNPSARLYVDQEQVARANEVIGSHDEPPVEPDLDTAWENVLASLRAPATSPVPPWPVTEDVDETKATVAAAPPATDYVEDDDHFIPPLPPPLPRLRRVTIICWLAIAIGGIVLISGFDGGQFSWLAILAIVGGAVTLVWHVRNEPPQDSGWDDGAVL
jgi:hypothetical protein